MSDQLRVQRPVVTLAMYRLARKLGVTSLADLRRKSRDIISSVDAPTADAVHWIRALRGRVECGDLDGHPPIDLGHGTGGLPAKGMVHILLADLDSLADLTPDQRATPINVTHQRGMRDELRRLREVLG
jgi:hypothetical protein